MFKLTETAQNELFRGNSGKAGIDFSVIKNQSSSSLGERWRRRRRQWHRPTLHFGKSDWKVTFQSWNFAIFLNPGSQMREWQRVCAWRERERERDRGRERVRERERARESFSIFEQKSVIRCLPELITWNANIPSGFRNSVKICRWVPSFIYSFILSRINSCFNEFIFHRLRSWMWGKTFSLKLRKGFGPKVSFLSSVVLSEKASLQYCLRKKFISRNFYSPNG